MTRFTPPLRLTCIPQLVALAALTIMSSKAGAQPPPAPVFRPAVTFTTGVSPFGVDAADIDLDGDLDIAVTASTAASVTAVWVYLNQGASVWAATPTKALKLAGIYVPPENCGVAEGTPPVQPNLTFGHFEFPGYPRDFYPDLAVTVFKSSSVWYLRNTGATGATPYVNYECVGGSYAFPVGILAADFDGDSYDDVAIAGRSDNSAALHRLALVWNNAGGGFTPTFVDAAPFSGRGYEIDLTYAGGVDSSPTSPRDIVMTGLDTNFVYVFKDGAGETINFFDRSPSVMSRGITAATLNNGDPHWDLATSNSVTEPHNLRWLKGLGGGVFDPPSASNLYPAPQPTPPATWLASPHGVDSGKINADSWIDVVVANEGSFGYAGSVSVFVSKNGVASDLFDRYDFWVAPPDPGPTPADTGPVQVILADLDGDNNLDIITTNSRDETIGVVISDL